VHELSGGEYQFLHTWACMAGPADVVLLDEPTNNLDAQGMALLGSMLAALGDARAVLVVSHEADFLARHCTRIVEVGR
jgi:ATPase subunit of ABC transporter with duplicated ATPase domains